MSVAVHRDGTIYVLEQANSKIRMVSPDFTTVSSLPSDVVGLQHARKILFTSSSETFIVVSAAIPSVFGTSNDQLIEVRISDSFRVKKFGADARNRDGVGAQARFNQPTAAAWTPEGALLVSQYDGAIRVVDWDAESVSTLLAPGSGISAPD